MKTNRTLLTAALLLAFGIGASAQNTLGGGQVSGNIQIDGQISREDTLIGSQDVPEWLLMNARADILYTNGNFSGGLRFEAYQNPMLGFDPSYKGQGVANYFAAYNGEKISVTAGNYYEQFGNGMILRAYEDRNLGLDNSLFGFNVKFRPVEGVTIKGVVGKQRKYWGYGDGVVRGVDGEVNLNALVKPMAESKTRLTLGAGFVSRYEAVTKSYPSGVDGFNLNIPENVGAGSVRLDLSHGGWGLQAEYARKGQDPNNLMLNLDGVNANYLYHPGEALFLSASYSQKGFSANVQAKRVDNMVFKNMREPGDDQGQQLYINYIPAITKQHTYAFLTLYPYATQASGEMGLTADVMYKIKKNTLLGGKYGTDLHFNGSVINGIQIDTLLGEGRVNDYVSPFFGIGERYYADATLEVAKKLSKSHKLVLTYGYVMYNPVVEGHGDLPTLHNHVAIADWTWKVNKKNVLRFEAEWQKSDQTAETLHGDKRAGDWVMGLVEWNFASNFFLCLSDQVNYANGNGAQYPQLSAGYTQGSTRLQVGYGKQREGMLCIGGVCRVVPAANGLTFSLTTSF